MTLEYQWTAASTDSKLKYQPINLTNTKTPQWLQMCKARKIKYISINPKTKHWQTPWADPRSANRWTSIATSTKY